MHFCDTDTGILEFWWKKYISLEYSHSECQEILQGPVLESDIWSAKAYSKALIVDFTLKKITSSFVVSTVPADGPVPLGARTSAGTMMINLGTILMG